MHIAFLTLFLGLVRGARPVALTASPGVARIELVLDGRSAGAASAPAWSTQIDFGPALLPHHLEARGLAADGSEVGRAEQWVNLPGPTAEVDIVAEGGTPGKPGAVRLTWQSLTGQPPIESHLTLDGAPLALDPQGRAAMESPAAGSAHVLSADLRFANGVEARKDVVWTADPAGDVATTLTAIPIRTKRPAKPLAVQEVAGLFAVGGRPLQVAAVDREPAEVFVVAPGLGGNRWAIQRSRAFASPLALEEKARVRFVAATPTHYQSAGAAAEVFDIGPAFSGFDLSVLPLADWKSNADQRPQTADAVAVAGLHALGAQVPRAVLLILGGNTTDGSLFDVAAVRGYLDAIGVPLVVWSMNAGARETAGWGDVQEISGAARKLRQAYLQLEDDLRRQQIVWVKGRHLPQSISLTRTTGTPGDLELVASASRAGGPISR